MGAITIKIDGSFRKHEYRIFSAVRNGHASAVASAINWLTGALQDAIYQDHQQHEAGERPSEQFGINTVPGRD